MYCVVAAAFMDRCALIAGKSYWRDSSCSSFRENTKINLMKRKVFRRERWHKIWYLERTTEYKNRCIAMHFSFSVFVPESAELNSDVAL